MAEDGEEGAAMTPGPSPESLFPHCKIVRSRNGYLQLSEKHLTKVIMDCVNGYSLSKDIPVVMLAVIGPPSSGKSFLTNLLIQYYKMEGGGGWLEKLTKKGKDGEQPGMTGFLWDSVEAEAGILKPSNTDLATSGVYLWPQPFIMNIHGDKQQLVWILHLVRGKDENDDDLRTLERFLMLACSRVTEIHGGTGDFRILREASKLKSGQPEHWMSLTQNHICGSIVYLFRSKSASLKSQSTTDKEAKQELSDLIEGTGLDISVLDEFDHINIVNIKDIDGDLHDAKGCLNMKVERNLPKSLKHIVGVITEESEISPKKDNGKEVQLADFFQFLKACVNTVNSLSASDQGRSSVVEATSGSAPCTERPPPNSSEPHLTLSSQTRKEIASAAGNRQGFPVKYDRKVLETNLDEICTGEMNYSYPPLPSDSDDESVPGKDFVVVHREDCTDTSKQEPVELQALTHTKLATAATTQIDATFPNTAVGSKNETEAVSEEALAREEKRPTSSSKPLPPPKVEVTAGHNGQTGNTTAHLFTRSQKVPEKVPEMNVNHGGEKSTRSEELQNSVIRVSQYQSMVARSYFQQQIRLPAAEAPAPPKHSSSRDIPSSEKQPEAPANHSRWQQEKQIKEETSSYPPQLEEMDTTPSHSVINNDHSNLLPIKSDGNNSTEVKEESMEVDNNLELEEASKRLEEEQEAKRKAEENWRRQQAIEEKRKREEEEERLKQVERERERQHKYDEMLKWAENAELQLKSMIPPAIEEWLIKQLTSANVEMSSVYNTALQAVLEEGHKYVDGTLWAELRRIVDNKCKNECTDYVGVVQDRIKKFNGGMRKKFDFLSCFTQQELESLGKEEFDKVSRGLFTENYEIWKLVEIGCGKLMDYSRAQNKEIVKNEERLAEDLIPDALHFYNEEMTRFLKEDVYVPNRLKEIHKALVEKLITAFTTAFKFTSNPKICENVENKLDVLREKLVQQFPDHLRKNDAKVKKTQEDMAKILDKSKKSYVEKVEDVLKINSEGLEAKEFQRTHADIVNEEKKLLEMEIRKKRREEPTGVYLKSLQAYIDDYWKCVFEVNSKNLKKRKEKEEQERKKLAEEEKQEREQNWLRRSSRLAEKRNMESVGKAESVSIPKQCSKNFVGKQLPPLVFQLQHTRIKMGMLIDGKPQILKNDSGEESTPFIVGLSKEGDLVCGSEVLASTLSEGDLSRSNIKNHWWVAEHFITCEDRIWSERIQLRNGEIHSISVEFLLGFILKKLKEQAETYMSGSCSVAIITVPFWFCSTRRIQVKDGGKLAGFSDVYLINEASAAAFACASSEKRSECAHNILVMSENAEHVDASVYAYSSGKQRVTMIGHCGSYCAEEKRHTGIPSRLASGALNMIGNAYHRLSKWTSMDGEPPTEDNNGLSAVRHSCKEALKQAQDPNYNSIGDTSTPNETFVIFESKNWKPLLEKIGKEKARKVCDIDEENAVIFGASLLSENPKTLKEKIRDKLAFDVMRKCGAETGMQVIPKKDLLPCSQKKASTTFPKAHKEGELFQHVMEKNISIGSFSLRHHLPGQRHVEVHMHISNEAIVQIAYVMVSSSTKSAEYAPENAYDWITPNLTPEAMTTLQSLLESLMVKKQESNELATAKQQLLQQCHELKGQLEAGTVFKIKSSVVKGMFAQKIEDAINVATHAKSTLDQIQGEMESLAKWSSKYIK